MLPVILVAVGAYLIGDSVLSDSKKYAKGGQTKEKLAEYLVTLTDEDGFEDDVVVMAKSEDDALYQAEKIKGYESSENGVVMLTDFDGNKIEYAKGGKTEKKKFTAYTILEADEYGNRDSSGKKKPTKFYIMWYGNSYQLWQEQSHTINSRIIFDNDDDLKKAIDKVRYSTPNYVNYGLPQDQKFYKEFIVSEKFEYAKGGELMSDEGDIPYNAIKKMQKIKINELNKWMPSHKYVWYDNDSKKFYFKDHLGRIMELKNGGTLGELDRFIKKNNISLKDDKMAHGGKTQGYDDKEDERLAMEHGKMSKKDLDSTHARRDDARFEERGKMAKGGETSDWDEKMKNAQKTLAFLKKEAENNPSPKMKKSVSNFEEYIKKLNQNKYAKGGELADVNKKKKALISKAKSKGIYENFGQKERRQLEDKYGYTSAVRDFDNWAMNFDLSQL